MRSHRRLAILQLEDRLTPTTASLSNGLLTVTGTAGNDAIAVRYANGRFTVDGVATSFARSAVTRVVVNAGAGNDAVALVDVAATIYGGDGNDSMAGGSGDDFIYGGAGADIIDGRAGNDYVSGDDGNDILIGDVGNDAIAGGAGDDYVAGSAGEDLLAGGLGRDTLYGGDGRDLYFDEYVRPAATAGKDGLLRAIAAKKGGETAYGSPSDVRQQLANTCAWMAALVAAGNDAATRIKYDYSDDVYFVPIYLKGRYTEQAIRFNGVWSDNDPLPQLGGDTGRDYWTALYQRAYLQAYNVDTSNIDPTRWAVRGTSAEQLTLQDWRYPEIAIESITGRAATAYEGVSDADFAAIQYALANGRLVLANTQTLASMEHYLDGTGLVFSHTYVVVAADASGITLRNPWGFDTRSEYLSVWDAARRAAFTLGNDSDGLVKVDWTAFRQAMATYVIA